MSTADSLLVSQPAPSHLQYLRELGIQDLGDAPVDAIVGAIEKALGDRKFMEQARWYVLSVYRHLTGGDWDDPELSDLPGDHLANLTAALLANGEGRSSLAAILRNRRSRYRLVEFAERADSKRQILSSSSKAYQFVRAQLYKEEAGDTLSALVATESIVSRRARRRHIHTLMPLGDPQRRPSTPAAPPALSLSAEEIAKLEKMLMTPAPGRPKRLGHYRSPEDRLSLAAGFVTGVVVFVLIWWLVLA